MPDIIRATTVIGLTYKGKTVTPEQATIMVKGKKLAYVIDTRFCQNAIKLAEDADLLLCEATFADALQDKAEEYKHMTAQQAGQLAKRAGAKRLVLTHFSQRYKDVAELEHEAKKEFPQASVANDFTVVDV